MDGGVGGDDNRGEGEGVWGCQGWRWSEGGEEKGGDGGEGGEEKGGDGGEGGEGGEHGEGEGGRMQTEREKMEDMAE